MQAIRQQRINFFCRTWLTIRRRKSSDGQLSRLPIGALSHGTLKSSHVSTPCVWESQGF
jgi:hypothetical protein